MIRLITYNIWMEDILFDRRIDRIARLIIKNNPDIVCLQEVTSRSFELLKKYLKRFYYFSRDEFYRNYDTLILSKHKILEINNFPFRNSNMGRSLRHIKVLINNKIINIFNIHLESNYRNNEIKNKQLESTFNRVSNYDNFFIMGDTNITNEINLPNYLKDVWIDFGKREDLKYTYDYLNNDHIHYKYRSRLDRIYLNQDWKIKDMEFIGNKEEDKIDGVYYPSDHFGVMIDVE